MAVFYTAVVSGVVSSHMSAAPLRRGEPFVVAVRGGLRDSTACE
jgi:hypothetical protein